MLSARISTLLIAGVFCALLPPTAYADESVGTTTEEVSPQGAATTTEDSPASSESPGVSSFSESPLDPTAFYTQIFFPKHLNRFAGLQVPQEAGKDGDKIHFSPVIDHAAATVSVVVDFSKLFGDAAVALEDVWDEYDRGTSNNLLRQFQGGPYTIASGGFNGIVSVLMTATDEFGAVAQETFDVLLDHITPSLSFTSITRSSTERLKDADVLLLSGTLDGTGSGARIFTIQQQELSADETVLGRFTYSSILPTATELYALQGGSFTDVPLHVHTSSGLPDFPENVAGVRYVFTIEDDAGNLAYATTSTIALDYTVEPPPPTGPKVSSVLFLPGIKGSRLYDTAGNKLWEPGSDQDVEKLFLTSAGAAANSGIHAKSGDIIETIAGFSEIYGSFIRSMNELQSTKQIKEWRIAPYDWRLSLDDIVSKGAVREDNIYFDETADIPYLELSLLELASSSPTHKVTIIAHSNGGLVAKALMQKLGDTETARLIDKVVFVGVPQSGAPQALGALLFGYKESLPSWFPFIVRISTARTFAENSPMGYHLLPSQRYFDDVLDKEHAVVRFTAASTYAEERATYGNVINSWEELRAFSLAEDKGREKPDAVLFFKPNVLNDFLLTYAKRAHDSIDAWVPPTGVTLYQIGGWGVDTVSGIEFYELCALSVCKKEYRPTFVQDGDGVVPISSALMLSTTTDSIKRFWVNLNLYGFGPIGNKDHGNILSITDVQHFLSNIILNDSSLPENILASQPAASVPAKRLRFMLHSPLTLHLYDSSGNHAGPTTDGDSEETIPGSEYGQFGEVQYITVPAGPEYTVEMNGLASGTFSLDIQEVSGGSIVASTTLASIPTQVGTIARMTISDTLATASSLSVDSDGNGSDDFLLPVSQDSTSFYQGPTEAVTESVSSDGDSRSRTIFSTPGVVSINTVPPSALPTTPSAQKLSRKVAQIPEATQSKSVVTAESVDETPLGNQYSQLASPLSVFHEVKDILISMLAGVYHFIIRIGSFLFTR